MVQQIAGNDFHRALLGDKCCSVGDPVGLGGGRGGLELGGGLLDFVLDLCWEVGVGGDHSAEDRVAAEESGESGWAEASGSADGFDEAGGGLGVGGLVEDGDEGVEFVLLVGFVDGPAVLGCGGVEEFGEDEFVEDLLAVGFGELGPEFLLGDWFAVDEGDGFGGGLWGGSGLGLGAADEKCAQECR